MFLVVKGTRIHPLGVVSGFHTNQNFVVGNNSKFKTILIENAQYRSLFSVKAVTQDQYREGWIAYSDLCWVVVLDLGLPLTNGMVTSKHRSRSKTNSPLFSLFPLSDFLSLFSLCQLLVNKVNCCLAARETETTKPTQDPPRGRLVEKL